MVPARSGENFKVFCIPSAHSLIHSDAQVTPHSTLLVTLFSPPSIICIRCIQTVLEMLHRPCGACFLPADTEEAISVRRGQIGWGSYLGRIMFDILHHYQLPLPPPQESYLSLADVPLSVMNFLCPPTSGPPHLSTPRLLLRGSVCVCVEGGGVEARK